VYRCENLHSLRIFSLNVLGLSYFDDEPVVSDEEPFDVESIRAALLEVILSRHLDI
jgi:hypothetical protein